MKSFIVFAFRLLPPFIENKLSFVEDEGREGVQGRVVWYVIEFIYFSWWKFNLLGKASLIFGMDTHSLVNH